ncbi:S-layer homology domain-containing protein [Candidatus Peregrinibacteria bacterium]|nr:S-layer homology domain-containing protein [Candidatus Peregrinibacteria bacterium]
MMLSRHPWVFALVIALLGMIGGLADPSFGRAQADLSLIGTFPDVPLSHPAYESIEYLARKGIVGGYPDGTFRPEQTMNRAEFTKIIVGTLFPALDVEGCLPSLPSELRFTRTLVFPDVARHQWFAKYVCKAKVAGIIEGFPDGTFRPALTINFAEAAKILVSGFKLSLPASFPAADPWFRPFVEALGEHHAIPLSVHTPDQRLTRGEMAEMVYRLQ